MVIYMIGIQQDRHYTVNTNVPCKRYGNTGTDNDNFNGINGYNPGLSVNQNIPIKNDNTMPTNNNLPPSCFPDQDDDLNNNNNNVCTLSLSLSLFVLSMFSVSFKITKSQMTNHANWSSLKSHFFILP